MTRYALETKLELLHFSLSQTRDLETRLKFLHAISNVQAVLDRLPTRDGG